MDTPTVETLADRLSKLSHPRMSCLVFRAFRPAAYRRYGAAAHPLNGTRRGCIGGRYNPAGAPPTLYTSTSRHGAVLEAEQAALMAQIPATRDALHVLAIEVGETPVVDLTDPRVLKALGVSAASLVANTTDWKRPPERALLTQRIGAAARRVACGLLAPSWIATRVRSTTPLDNAVLFLAGDRPWQPDVGFARLVDPGGRYDRA